jgi:hypothetical protein
VTVCVCAPCCAVDIVAKYVETTEAKTSPKLKKYFLVFINLLNLRFVEIINEV